MLRLGMMLLAVLLAACTTGDPATSTQEAPAASPGVLVAGETAATACEQAVVAMWETSLSDDAYAAAYDLVFATCTNADLIAMNAKAAEGWGFTVSNGRTNFTKQECRSPRNQETKLCQSVE